MSGWHSYPEKKGMVHSMYDSMMKISVKIAILRQDHSDLKMLKSLYVMNEMNEIIIDLK